MRPEFLLRFFGRLHVFVAILLLIPFAVGLACGDRIFAPYLGPAVFAAAVGLGLMYLGRRISPTPPTGLRRREGFLLVSFSWLLMILYGALPFYFSGSITDFASAIFESASGFTTTGATIVKDIEALPQGLLFWRCFSHWIGGMGIIVLSVAILPELAVGGMQLFAAESSGLSVDKLAPRIAQTSKRLWGLYVGLTVVEVFFLLAGGMTWLDAVSHACATTATGGFSTKQASIAHYSSAYIDWVITAFMFLSGVNFALQYRALRGEVGKAFRSTELRFYVGIAVVFTSIVTANLVLTGTHDNVGDALRYGAFQVVSILTTTGFGTEDFSNWPLLSISLILMLMAIGGCAGSTAGGLKIIRLVVILKHAARECRRLLYPRMVSPVTVDGKAVDDDILFSILGYLSLYTLVFVVTTVLLTVLPHNLPADNPMDIVTSSTASLSALNSIGPGLGHVGPSGDFAFVHPMGKIALSFCMLLGRLEIYTLLVLFLPRFWRS